ncbi:transposable element Tcb1 transposase [Trichonephila clavipes]|nr:transposable element Tcb1 transposase [Trichonephila clavipes]
MSKKIALKIWCIKQTGNLDEIEEICNKRWPEARKFLTKAWGISPRIAFKLYKEVVKIIFDVGNNIQCDAGSSLRRKKKVISDVSILVTLIGECQNNHQLLPDVVAKLHRLAEKWSWLPSGQDKTHGWHVMSSRLVLLKTCCCMLNLPRLKPSPIGVVWKLWQRFQEDGNVSRCYSTGRPRVTTPNEDRYLAVIAKRNRRSTASDLSCQLFSATGTTVSRQTVYRRLGHVGLYARRPVRCIPLTTTHCRLRLTWSTEHALWTPQHSGLV